MGFGSKLVHFIKSKQFRVHFLLLITTILIIVFGTLFYLDSFTHFGEKIPVPNFVADKVHVTDLENYVEGKQIRYEILDSVYRTDIPSGTVFYQQPGPTDSTGMYVKEGRKIKLRIATDYLLVEMPQLAGKSSRRFAEASLKNRGLRPAIQFTTSNEGKDQVMEQLYKGKTIVGGTKVPVGSKIILVVSKGYSLGSLSVPNLIGSTISDAKLRLSELGLSLYTICSDCNETDNPDAIIFDQSPSALDSNARVTDGGTVTVYAKIGG